MPTKLLSKVPAGVRVDGPEVFTYPRPPHHPTKECRRRGQRAGGYVILHCVEPRCVCGSRNEGTSFMAAPILPDGSLGPLVWVHSKYNGLRLPDLPYG